MFWGLKCRKTSTTKPKSEELVKYKLITICPLPKENLYFDFQIFSFSNLLTYIFLENKMSYSEGFWNTFSIKEQET